mgnify:CR=1 FL=1
MIAAAFALLILQQIAPTVVWDAPAPEAVVETPAPPPEHNVPAWGLADPFGFERARCSPLVRGQKSMAECQTEVREQLAKLADSLQPTEPGGVSPLGSAINTTADNLRGQGANIRDAVIKLSQAISALGDKSTNVFSTVKNLAILVSALQDSTDVMRQLNQNLASVTGLLADDPDEVANAVRDLNAVVGEVQTFVAENRRPSRRCSPTAPTACCTARGSRRGRS